MKRITFLINLLLYSLRYEKQ